MKFTLPQKILSFYLVFLLTFWIILFRSGSTTSFWNYFYSFSFSLIPLIGGLFGMFSSKPWGMLKSAIGKSVFFIAAGLFTWGVGSMIWSYYNFFNQIVVPYPSLADFGFTLSLPLWILGIVSLSKATGARFGLKHIRGKIQLILIPVIVMAVSYYLLVIVARGGILTESFDNYFKLFFDLAYPFGDVIIVTLALLIFGLSFNYFGGRYKLSIFTIILGFIFMYLADFIFSYTTTIETFYNGNWGDLIFTIALFFITFGNLGFYLHPKREK